MQHEVKLKQLVKKRRKNHPYHKKVANFLHLTEHLTITDNKEIFNSTF